MTDNKIGIGKPTRRGQLDGEPFITALERASEAGNGDFVPANMDQLETLIAQLQDRGYEHAELQGRARLVRDSHEAKA